MLPLKKIFIAFKERIIYDKKTKEKKMQIKTVQTTPFQDQKMGTSGLRKKTKVFLENKNYLENFIQAIFNVIDVKGKRLVLGGDGRYFNKEAIQIILKMAISSNAKEILLGINGYLSTPALSFEVRNNHFDGGIILTASHNPGGMNGDFGVKFNGSNGAPAPENLTTAFTEESKKISAFQTIEMPDIALDKEGVQIFENTTIRVVDAVKDYADFMETIFDFDVIRALFKKGFTMHYDAFNAVTGPYAKEIFENRLGASAGSVVNAEPLPDFGGRHPDPNLTYAKDLVCLMYSENSPDFGAAADGDGDRYMVLGKSFFVTPADSVAILADNAGLVKGYQGDISGVARSMPTATPLDRVAKAHGWDLYEVPTGWKFFGSLLDAGRILFCGEESFSASSSHIREKDGIWALLFWLTILAKTGKSVEQIVHEHWQKYGRSYAVRYDFENLTVQKADEVMENLRQKLPTLTGQNFADTIIEKADEFTYTDPVNGAVSAHQGIRIFLQNGSRIVFRISGTGTQGATIRLYLEKYEKNDFSKKATEAVQDLADNAIKLASLKQIAGIDTPSVIT